MTYAVSESENAYAATCICHADLFHPSIEYISYASTIINDMIVEIYSNDRVVSASQLNPQYLNVYKSYI